MICPKFDDSMALINFQAHAKNGASKNSCYEAVAKIVKFLIFDHENQGQVQTIIVRQSFFMPKMVKS